MSIVLTRKELYDRAWSEPMQKLSKEFGLSLTSGSPRPASATTFRYLRVGTGRRSRLATGCARRHCPVRHRLVTETRSKS